MPSPSTQRPIKIVKKAEREKQEQERETKPEGVNGEVSFVDKEGELAPGFKKKVGESFQRTADEIRERKKREARESGILGEGSMSEGWGRMR